MFTYRCPGCGKQHVAESAPESGFQAKCLRCGRAFPVTAEAPRATAAARPATSEAITKRPAVVVGNGLADQPGDTQRLGRKLRQERAQALAPEEETREDGPEESYPGPGSEADAGEEEPMLALDPIEGEEPPGEGPDSPKKPKAAKLSEEEKEALGKRKLVIGVSVGVAALLLLGVGYWLFGTGSAKTPPKKPVAKKDNKPAPPPEKEPEVAKGPDAPPPPAKKTRTPTAWLSAPRLAAFLAADPHLVDDRYEGVVVEVSGLFGGLQAPPKEPAAEKKDPPEKEPEKEPEKKEPDAKPALPWRAYFRTDVGTLACELPGEFDPNWRKFKPLDPIAVLAVYRKGGVLREVEMVPPRPPADVSFRGKKVEVSGLVAEASGKSEGVGVFPTLRFQKETVCKVGIVCVFPKSAGEEVGKLKLGDAVTVQGDCSGRMGGVVQLDNCRLVYTTAPEAGLARLDAFDFGRLYDEDLRTFFLPQRGKEERVGPLPPLQLAEEFEANRQQLNAKYRFKMLGLAGVWSAAVKEKGAIDFESPKTNHKLRITCRFRPNNFPNLNRGDEIELRGLCLGLSDPQTLLLEDCELVRGAAVKEVARITADYLPHRPGTVRVYDVAAYTYQPKARTEVFRQVSAQAEGGLIHHEITRSHSGPLPSKTLFAEKQPSEWLALPKVKKPRLVAQPSYHRVSGGYVEIGQIVIYGKPPKKETIWEPVLKIGAKRGDTWEWISQGLKHKYTVAGFGTARGRPSVEIRESILDILDIRSGREIVSTYAVGLGEVERVETVPDLVKDERLAMEKRLRLEEELEPIKKEPKKEKGPAGPGKEEKGPEEAELIPDPKPVKR